MSSLITPFAPGSVLNPEQGGTGIDSNDLTQGQLLGGDSTGVIAPINLLAGTGISVNLTVAGQITLTANNSTNIVTKAANYIVTANDDTLLGNAAPASFIFTLPTAASASSKKYIFKKIDATANTVTVRANGVETIDGSNTVVLANRYDSITVQSNGTFWSIL